MSGCDIAVAIVNWNVRDLLIECLTSVFRAMDAARLCGEVWVVDNASSDGSVQTIRERFSKQIDAECILSAGCTLSAGPRSALHLIASPINLWFGGGQNLAMRAMGFSGVSMPGVGQTDWIRDILGEHAARQPGEPHLPRYVLVLNPDTLVRRDALGEMVRFMDRTPNAGVCGPRLVYGDGRFQHAAYRFPSLAQTFLDFWPLYWRLLESRLNGRYARRLYGAREPFCIDHPLGAAMLFRREVIQQSGGFDLGYKMYVEEIDWCKRVKRAGWDIYCVPSAEIVHYEGQSTRQVRPEMVVALWRSRCRFFAKHYSSISCWIVRRLIRAGMRDKIRRTRAALSRQEMDEATARSLSEAYQQVIELSRGRGTSAR